MNYFWHAAAYLKIILGKQGIFYWWPLGNWILIIILFTVGIWIPDVSGFQMAKSRLVAEWSKIWMGSENWKPNHLKSIQMAFCQIPFEIQTNNCGFRLVRTITLAQPSKTRPFKTGSLKSLDFEWLYFRFPLYNLWLNSVWKKLFKQN